MKLFSLGVERLKAQTTIPCIKFDAFLCVVFKIKSMYEQFAKLAYDTEACKTINPRQMWLQLERSMPYEGSIYCDVPPWPSSVRVLVS